MRLDGLKLIALLSLPVGAHALILVGGGNADNITAPGSGVPWDQVARVTNSAGTHKESGSAVYLGNGYMLTANHVNLNQGYVSFDGTTTYSIKSGSAVQIASGVDLKVFELDSNPGFSGVQLISEADKGLDIVNGFYEVIVGWGVGHNPTDTGNPWTWGDADVTSTKRWGLNDVLGYSTINYSLSGVNYNVETLVTSLGTDQTAEEAAVTIYDSGAAMFYFNGSDWVLSGVPVTVETGSISNFGTDSADIAEVGRGDLNFFARIAEYSNEINALIPEPSAFGLVLGFSAILVGAKRRR